MMLIPQPPNFGISENLTHSLVKANYFSPRENSEVVTATASVTEELPTSAFRSCPQPQDRSMFAPRMQSDVTGFNMYGGPPGAPGTGAITSPAAYGAPTNPHHSFVPPHYGSSGIEHSPYYPSLGPTGYETKAGAGGEVWPAGYGQGAPPYYQYDNFGAQYSYDSRYCGMDVNDGVRRKNATRESTNTLKAWLQEHKKNPYPTKGEKIMLAIITKMTLTQVSTWFANARRRLKKENKMTWVPKNRTNDSSNSSEDRRESDDKDSDEKLDDDCQSDTEGEEQITKSNKSDLNSDVSETNDGKSACHYQQDNSLNYGQDSEIVNQPGSDHSPGGRFSSNPSQLVDSNIRSRLQDTDQSCPPFDHVQRDLHQPHRSIWSPLENRDGSQTNRESFRDFQEHSRQPYDIGHTQNSTIHHHMQGDGGIHHPPQGFPVMQNSQPNPFPPTSSHDRFATTNLSGSPGSATSHNIDNDSMDRRNECRFTSPVTNLQNWVNGVFHGPTSQPGAVSGDKMHTTKLTTADEATDLTTRINFSYQHQYKHAPLTSSKSEQYGQVGPNTVSSSFPSDYYDQHRALSKQHSANVVQSGSPFYQPGIDGTPPPNMQTKAHITDCNTMTHPGTQRSSPKACSLSPQGQASIPDRIPFYDVSAIEQRSDAPPPPYVTHFQADAYQDRSMMPNHNYVGGRNGYLSPTHVASGGTAVASPSSTLTGSNTSTKVEYKISQMAE